MQAFMQYLGSVVLVSLILYLSIFRLTLADVWIGGDVSVDGNFWTINGGANIFFDVPDVSNVMFIFIF